MKLSHVGDGEECMMPLSFVFFERILARHYDASRISHALAGFSDSSSEYLLSREPSQQLLRSFRWRIAFLNLRVHKQSRFQLRDSLLAICA
jgi:hypothetical protein